MRRHHGAPRDTRSSVDPGHAKTRTPPYHPDAALAELAKCLWDVREAQTPKNWKHVGEASVGNSSRALSIKQRRALPQSEGARLLPRCVSHAPGTTLPATTRPLRKATTRDSEVRRTLFRVAGRDAGI
jgi:hypothetical protein